MTPAKIAISDEQDDDGEADDGDLVLAQPVEGDPHRRTAGDLLLLGTLLGRDLSEVVTSGCCASLPCKTFPGVEVSSVGDRWRVLTGRTSRADPTLRDLCPGRTP